MAVQWKGPRKHKFKARPVIVRPDLSILEGETIRRAAIAKCVPFTRTRKNGAQKPLTLRELAAACDLAGEYFQSIKEGRRFVDLTRLQNVGRIRSLRRQVDYPLYVRNPNGLAVRIGLFRADFVYEEPTSIGSDLFALGDVVSADGWQQVVEDCKGFRTDLYLWKQLHWEAQHGKKIRET